MSLALISSEGTAVAGLSRMSSALLRTVTVPSEGVLASTSTFWPLLMTTSWPAVQPSVDERVSPVAAWGQAAPARPAQRASSAAATSRRQRAMMIRGLEGGRARAGVPSLDRERVPEG